MREVGVLEAKTNLSALIEAVERGGEDILITRHGKPVARLSAAASQGAGHQSGKALLAQAMVLRERISREAPQTDDLSWSQIKDEMRR